MKKIILILSFALIFFAVNEAKAKVAGCEWVINSSCSDIQGVAPSGGNNDCGAPNASNQKSYSTYKCCCTSQITGCCETKNRNTSEVTARDGLNQAQCQSNATWAEITNFSTTMRAQSNRCVTPSPPAGGGCCLCYFPPDSQISDNFANAFSDNNRDACNSRAGIAKPYVSCTFYPGQVPDSINSCKEAPKPTVTSTDDGIKTQDSQDASPQVRGEAALTLDPIDNPLGVSGAEGVSTVIGRVISSLFSILGTITVLMIIYGGWLWMTAQGNDAKVAQARKIITWAFLGVTLIFVAYVLVRFVFEIATSTG